MGIVSLRVDSEVISHVLLKLMANSTQHALLVRIFLPAAYHQLETQVYSRFIY